MCSYLGAGGRDVLLPAASPECKGSRRLGTDRSPGNLRRAEGGEGNKNNCCRGQSCPTGLRERHLPAQGCPWGRQQDVAAAGWQQHPLSHSSHVSAGWAEGHGQREPAPRSRTHLGTARRERSVLPACTAPERHQRRATPQCHPHTSPVETAQGREWDQDKLRSQWWFGGDLGFFSSPLLFNS